MNAEDWLSAYAEQLGASPPSPTELEALLALAGVAAHASERRAAPVACWLAAQAGVAPGDALALARNLGERAGGAADPERAGGAADPERAGGAP